MLLSVAHVISQDALLTEGLPLDIVGNNCRPNVRSITRVKIV
jgi:hypothetical protein